MADMVSKKRHRVEALYNADVKCLVNGVIKDPSGFDPARVDDTRPKTADVLTCDHMLSKDTGVDGVPVVKLWDPKEHVKPRYVSLFTLALYLENVTASTKAALRNLFGKNDEVKHMDLWQSFGKGERFVNFIGVKIRATGGATFLATCVTNGFVYRPAFLTTPRYDMALTVLKDMYIDTVGGASVQVSYYFFVILSIPRDENHTMKKMYIVRSPFHQYKCIVPVVQTAFLNERVQYVDTHIEAEDLPTPIPFGTIDRIGHSAEKPIHTTLITKGLSIPIVKIERFTVDYKQDSVFF
ncbi:triplex capsid protein 1 [Elephant endotheliotropic herpesvirus 1A]|uniref:Triplex capsid protein 1 n=2 Tax=Elephant endotheliotropic herpesvirus 1A TaxID=759753 RepID=M1RV91_ELHV1|nr:triplex capsid protein 1 [Elephant endotheliotropic herpesvirus 1A]QOE75062.1 triplex capsid protein 1 [Elephant endotheliotropic herpesvirus 1A]QYM88460.1 triplex capsid protein 1 [Elephant endotheliotropic herpesvirus 1A]